MRVRDWQDVLADVVESTADPEGWRAVAGDRSRGIGEDLYLGHPAAGVYHLKTYAKNPFEVRGVGSKVARRVDEDLEPLFPREGSGRFGVQSPVEDEREAAERARDVETVVETHADAPTTGVDLFEDVMAALDSPAYGPMEYDGFDRPDRLDDFAGTFEEAESLLEAEFEDLVEDDGVGRGVQ